MLSLHACSAGPACAGATLLLPPRRCLRGATATVFAAKPGQDSVHMRLPRELHTRQRSREMTDDMQRSREIMQDLTMKASLWAAAFAVLSVASAVTGNTFYCLFAGLIACWLAYFAVKYATAVR